LKAVLNNHVVAGKMSSGDLKIAHSVTARGGGTWTVGGDGKLINDAKVVQPDMVAENGMIHGVDQLLMKNAAPGTLGGDRGERAGAKIRN